MVERVGLFRESLTRLSARSSSACTSSGRFLSEMKPGVEAATG